MRHIKFLDFYAGGMNRLHASLSLIQIYPSYSIRRKILKALNLLNTVGPKIAPKNLCLLQKYLIRYSFLQDNNPHVWLLHKLDQNGRAYFFELNDHDQIISVAKLAITQEASIGIQREYDVLARLSFIETPFWFPKIVRFQKEEDTCLLQTTAVPTNYVIHNKNTRIPDELFDAIGSLRPSNTSGKLPAKDIPGWQNVLPYIETPLVLRIASNINHDSLYEVSAAHRDLGSENIFTRRPLTSAKDCALIDWEFYTDIAPALTDRVGFWLGRHHRYLKGRRHYNLDMMATNFIDEFVNADGGADAAILALLHLADMGIDLARILIGDRR